MKFTLVQQLQSFYKRRIDIAVDSKDLVLDIGSGDKPHWRADVLLDQYVLETDGIQRSGNSAVATPKPLIVSPMENMPFKDRVFDYVICSHILEHVMDPVKAMNELMRVSKAGYIEVPFEGAAKVIDVPSHLWYCRMEGKKLIFTAKKTVAFDPIIDRLMSTREMLYGFASLGQKYWDKFIIELYWKGKIQYKVTGKASRKMFIDAQKAEVIHNSSNFLLRNIANAAISLFFQGKKRKKEIYLEEIMQCNACRGKLMRKDKGFVCQKCKNKIIVLGL